MYWHQKVPNSTLQGRKEPSKIFLEVGIGGQAVADLHRSRVAQSLPATFPRQPRKPALSNSSFKHAKLWTNLLLKPFPSWILWPYLLSLFMFQKIIEHLLYTSNVSLSITSNSSLPLHSLPYHARLVGPQLSSSFCVYTLSFRKYVISLRFP